LACVVVLFGCGAFALLPPPSDIETRIEQDERVRATWIGTSGRGAANGPCIVVLPGKDYPALWDRRDSATSVSSGLARLGYLLCVLQPEGGPGTLPLSSKELEGWLHARNWPEAGIALVGWSDDSYTALEAGWPELWSGEQEGLFRCVGGFLNGGGIEALEQRLKSRLHAKDDFAKSVHDVRTEAPPIYLSCSREDKPRLDSFMGRLRRESPNPISMPVINVPYNAGPVFPHEPNHWKRSLDLWIDFLFRYCPPARGR
jgi:hypothetical protein